MTDERSMTMDERLERLSAERAAIQQFDANRVLPAGRLSPRARIAALLDESSFVEVGALSHSQHEKVAALTPADGVITGYGSVGGREVAVISEDPLALVNTDAQVAKGKRNRLIDQAVYKGLPLVYLADGAPEPHPVFPPGEGMLRMKLAEQQTARDVAERTAPFVVVVFGSCTGQDAAFAAGGDIVIATSDAAIRATEGAPGGSDGNDGLADVVAETDSDALAVAARFLSLIPSDPRGPLAPRIEATPPPVPLSDEDATAGPARLLDGLLDADTSVRFDAGGARDVLGGIGTLEGYPVAFVIPGSESPSPIGAEGLARVARAVGISSRFRLPLIVAQDCLGYDPAEDRQAELLRLVRALVADLHASEALKIAVVTGRGHVLGDFVLGGRGASYDLIWAWPTASIGTSDVRSYQPDSGASGPWEAADLGIIDDVIAPSETRGWIARALRVLARARAVPPPFSDRGVRLLDPE